MPSSVRRFAFTFLLLCGCGVASAWESDGKFDWPQWQGPNRQANCLETGLLKTWPENGPPLLWQTRDLGIGFSTPSVAAGRIYGMSQRANNDGVWCLDEKSGKEIWFQGISSAQKVNFEGARCTPTVDRDRLYALTVGGVLGCLECGSGKLVWKKNLVSDFGGRMMSQWGYSESPLVDGEQVICTPGGAKAALVALNKKNGNVIWKTEMADCGGAGYASCIVSEAGGIRQYITFVGKSLISVDAKTGKLLWRYDKVANRTANCSSVIVKDDFVFASSSYGVGSVLLKIEAKGKGLAANEIRFLDGKTFQNHHGGMALVGEHIYGGHGQNRGEPTCIDFKTGEVAWKDRAPGSGSAAVLAFEGGLIFRYQDGTMALIEANPTKFNLKAKFKLPYDSGKPSWPHPIIANGRLYIREQDVLMCFDVKEQKAAR